MATPTADKLKTYFPSRYIAADGNTLTQYSVDSAAARTITDAALTESDDYWAGAIGWFDGDTLTPQLQGCFFHVRSFDATTDTLMLSRDLPAVPQAGDTFRLVIGGNRRSSQETFSLMAAGYQPELQPVSLANITGVTITKASGLLGEGDITLHYDATLEELYLKKAGEEYGVGLSVSGDVVDGVIFAENAQSYLRVNVTAASLPVSNATEIVTLTCPEAVFTPDFEGYETADGAGGKARYRLEVLRNDDPVDTMVDLSVYTAKPAGAATTITSSLSLTTSAGELTIDNPANWPTNSFWVKNTTRDDCRYIKYRSGSTLYTTDTGTGLRGFTAVNWEQGDNVEVLADVDIAVETPDGGGVFSSPVDETTPPAGLTFADKASVNDSIYIGDLAPGEMVGVWRRETIVGNHRSRKQIRTDTIALWS